MMNKNLRSLISYYNKKLIKKEILEINKRWCLQGAYGKEWYSL